MPLARNQWTPKPLHPDEIPGKLKKIMGPFACRNRSPMNDVLAWAVPHARAAPPGGSGHRRPSTECLVGPITTILCCTCEQATSHNIEPVLVLPRGFRLLARACHGPGTGDPIISL